MNVQKLTAHSMRLVIKDTTTRPLVIGLPDVPLHIRDKLMRHSKGAWPDCVTFTDSKSLGENLKFKSFHCSVYDRFTVRVCFSVGI